MPIRHKLSPAARQVIQRLQSAGYDAYLVGGAVRDLLLDIEPKDYDVATSARPEEVKDVFGRSARIIGRRFRLAHVYADGEIIEVSTFRREPTLEERKGRDSDDGLIVWRDNVFGSLEEDARRRDFTVNAVYFDPVPEGGRTIDYVGGLDDMRDRVVRAIGDPDIRIQEDPVRILRACKLVAQYDFRLEPELANVIRRHSPQIELSSSARLVEEIFKVLKKPYTCKTLQACHESGLLPHLLPGIAKHWETPAGEYSRRMLSARDRQMSAGLIFPSRVTGLAALVLPFVVEELGQGDMQDLWENFSGVNKSVRHLVQRYLHPYQIPRETVARICDVLLIQPKFLSGQQRWQLGAHPEYNRGRDLFSVFIEATGLDPERLASWPDLQHHGQHRRPPRRSRGGRRRSS